MTDSGLDAKALREIRAVIDAMDAYLYRLRPTYSVEECEDLIKTRIPRWVDTLRGALIPPAPPGGFSPRPDPGGRAA